MLLRGRGGGGGGAAVWGHWCRAATRPCKDQDKGYGNYNILIDYFNEQESLLTFHFAETQIHPESLSSE